MARAYPIELRERVLRAYDHGYGSIYEVAGLFGMSRVWVQKLLRQRRETGSIEPKVYKPGPKPKLTEAQRERLCQLAADQPDLTLEELRRRLRMRCSIVTVWRAFKQMGFTKKKSLKASEQLRDAVQLQRKQWRRRMKRIDPGRLVFLDESGVRVGMKRLYGRSARGWRIVDYTSGGHWQTHTVTAAIRAEGITAAMVTRRAINSITFLGFIEEFLCPTLREGDLVVMDNLAVHKVKGVEAALRAVGAKPLYLPPYSPDLNPIELAWAKVKALLRAKAPSTFRKLVNALGKTLSQVSSDDCTNFMRHDGYAV